jgi:hypothetical protein
MSARPRTFLPDATPCRPHGLLIGLSKVGIPFGEASDRQRTRTELQMRSFDLGKRAEQAEREQAVFKSLKREDLTIDVTYRRAIPLSQGDRSFNPSLHWREVRPL